MKKVLLGCVFVTLSLIGFAQNPDSEKVKLEYIQLPEVPFAESITMYETKVEIPYGLSSYENREIIAKSLESSMTIPGYNKVDKEGQIQVTAVYYGFSTKGFEYRKEEKDEKRDDKTVKVTYHYYTFEYKLPVELKVTLNGEVLESFYVNNSNDYGLHRTSGFKSVTELNNYWKENKDKVYNDIKQKSFEYRTSTIKSFLRDKYGYFKTSTSEKLYTFKTKKHNYEDYDNALAIAKEAFALHTNENIYPSEEFQQKINEAITIWTKALEESDPENKKARVNEKITGLTCKNLAFAHLWLLEFDKAQEYITKGGELDKGDDWVKEYQRELNAKKKKFQAYEEVMNKSIN